MSFPGYYFKRQVTNHKILHLVLSRRSNVDYFFHLLNFRNSFINLIVEFKTREKLPESNKANLA